MMGSLPTKLFFGASLVSVMVLAGIVLVSAFTVVTVTHQTRLNYASLQTLERERDELQAVWSRLLLEESTWSTPSRVESISQQRLDMHVPAVNDTEVLAP
ncbi:cell division protein FtsL [Halotalea alkalilenta]|uniref:Cell division protein FtsL n=1 Tax=Halotalea alkalilenta TaxID=376489 RepID=A0A172YK34_9GAMM|nr:cell division protein FtsL [Halotalea alkalilenta]ANF59577.1 cell division protein FtsL [Halotalea alkalilenta]